MRTVVAALLWSSLALPASVLADPSPTPTPTQTRNLTPTGAPPGAAPTDDCARARKAGKPCVLDVPAEDVGGRTATASDAGTQVLVFRPEGSLLRLRRDFLPEIVKAAEAL